MKFIQLTFFTFLLWLPCTAQVTPQNANMVDSIREKIFTEYKALCLKQWQSPTHKKSDSLYRAFNKKVHADKNIKFDPVKYTHLNYIAPNLANTDFKSYEEAEKEWKAYTDSVTLDVEANKDVMDYVVKILLTQPQYSDVISEAMIEVIHESIFNTDRK